MDCRGASVDCRGASVASRGLVTVKSEQEKAGCA